MAEELIFQVVGARPHFIKAAPFMQAMKKSPKRVFTIHTGQHYDRNMSEVFFDELDLPEPDVNLGIGSGTHAVQTAGVMTHVEALILQHKPSAMVVYGDTNTTLGAALASAKLYVPTVHVEAGVRCGNRRYPEEINRKVIDHVSDFLACPSQLAVDNLKAEGLEQGVHFIGDFMYDTFLQAQAAASSCDVDLDKYGVESGAFALSTLHREKTTASPERLREVLDTLGDLGLPVLLPIHPRTRACMERAGIPCERSDGLKIIEPVSYLEMMSLLNQCRMVLTDSGGLEKEAYWAAKPCVTLLEETTWTETIDAGWNILAGLDPALIRSGVEKMLSQPVESMGQRPEVYGKPGAAQRFVEALGWS